MTIGIIGAGFTGLSAAYTLTKKGHHVSIFEKGPRPGGLALGFQQSLWEWSLEEYYHHWFTNDNDILSLAHELHHPVLQKRPKTSVYIDQEIFQLDSPLKLLQFSKLSLTERIHMALGLALLRYNPLWKPLEHFTTSTTLPLLIGKRAYTLLWEPQLTNKFGHFVNDISLAWFWARITKRTTSLAYPAGGFLAFSETLAKAITDRGGTIRYNASVETVTQEKNTISLGKLGTFDKVIVTLPSFALLKLCPQFPQEYKKKLEPLKGLGASVLVLRLTKPFFKDNTYWLSVCDKKSPIMAIVEHTNFMDKKHYNNEHIVYIGNYLEPTDPRFSMTKEHLLALYDPFLKKINPTYTNSIIATDLFRVPFAQPIVPKNYSTMIPPFETPFKNVYLANMQQVYPWDRGTNYAVALGTKVAEKILHDNQ